MTDPTDKLTTHPIRPSGISLTDALTDEQDHAEGALITEMIGMALERTPTPTDALRVLVLAVIELSEMSPGSPAAEVQTAAIAMLRSWRDEIANPQLDEAIARGFEQLRTMPVPPGKVDVDSQVFAKPIPDPEDE